MGGYKQSKAWLAAQVKGGAIATYVQNSDSTICFTLHKDSELVTVGYGSDFNSAVYSGWYQLTTEALTELGFSRYKAQDILNSMSWGS